jgi:activator of HSP90 ATPase
MTTKDVVDHLFSTCLPPPAPATQVNQRMTNPYVLSRRGFGRAAALGLSTLGVAAAARSQLAAAAGAQGMGITHGNAAIHQEVAFKATPDRVYAVLTDPALFDKVVQASGALQAMGIHPAPVQISPEPGGSFSMFGGYITGRHIEMSAGVRLVQAWRSRSWAPHIYSIVRFELSAQPDGTKLSFDHAGFPNDDAASLATGWHEHYWVPMAKVLAG